MSDRISRRQVLATIALADAPAPSEIAFRQGDTMLRIDLDRLANLRPWAKVFGIDAKAVNSAFSKDRLTHYKTSTGVQMVGVYVYTDWQGWKVSIDADEPESAGIDPLDDTTREQLRAVAADNAKAAA